MSSLFLLVACEQQVDGTKSLSDSERRYLDELAAKKCITDSNKTFEGFHDNTVAKLRDLDVERSFKIEFTKDKAVIETFKLDLWKVTGSSYFFKFEVKEGGVTYTKYIKFDEAMNEKMVKAIQSLKCSNNEYKIAASSSSMTINRADERRRQSGSDWVQNSEDYRFVTQFPAYFGTLNMARTVKTSTTETGTQKSEVYDTKFASTSTAVTHYSSYKDSRYPNIRYCIPMLTKSGSDYIYKFPFELKCVKEEELAVDVNRDGTVDYTGIDVDGDDTPDFEPADEL